MTNILIKLFVKNKDDIKNPQVRKAYSFLASIFGIISNLVIAISKLVVGILFNLISITADAINNISDASSSIVSLVGIKLSNIPADSRHPFGHARIEYLTGFIIAIIISALGITLIYNSCLDIYNVAIGVSSHNPLASIEFIITVSILSISILIKIYQSLLNYQIGSKIDSLVLKATAVDSRNDVIATSLVLIGLIVTQYCSLGNFSLDGLLGVMVGLFIGYSGIKLILETADPLLGKAPDQEVVNEFTHLVKSHRGVLGMHDLQIHSYGPNCIFATAHVEVDASKDVLELHNLLDRIERDCKDKLKIFTTLHMDPVVLYDQEQNKLKRKVLDIIKTLPFESTIHDFRVVKDRHHIDIEFDMLVSFKEKRNNEEIEELLKAEIEKIDPNYHLIVDIDRD